MFEILMCTLAAMLAMRVLNKDRPKTSEKTSQTDLSWLEIDALICKMNTDTDSPLSLSVSELSEFSLSLDEEYITRKSESD